ncbi:MAG: bifunctional riboflavin kinase/FAD synthetase [Actinomyces sp.]|nr:MAG: bifunctional riboflavin kinase/FAD synthetase [Actinomyces sp.]
MHLLHDLQDRLADGESVVCTIGVFDGVHLGHREVIATVQRSAAELGVASAVVTFDGHPAHVVRPDSAPPLLTTLDQKLELLEDLGVDYVYLVHFDHQRARTGAEEFARQVFAESLHARRIVVGEDFHFGRGREGDVAALRRFGAAMGFEVVALPLVPRRDGDPEPVSSTAIRRALAAGDVEAAAAMLGRWFSVRGRVVEGDRRGRTIGFPTANLPVPTVMAWPADGVYAGWCTRTDGSRWPCAVNIGRRPTFHTDADHRVLEAHLCGFDGDLYGEQIEVAFVARLRDEKRFDGVDELVAQLTRDVAAVRERLGVAAGPEAKN